MRNHVINEITKMAENNPRIMILTGDLGFGVLDDFARKYPKQYINMGIAEQNMISVAAGLAMEGNEVFVYSIGNFPTLRCIEQIRNMVCYHNANVKILSLGGGFAYGSLGMTHHATEDIAMMRSLPNMEVYVPSDAIEAVACLKEACATQKPAFIRMARGKEPNQHLNGKEICVSKIISIVQCENEDVNIFTTGTILSEGSRVQEILLKKGIRSNLFSVPRIKPLDQDSICKYAARSKLVITMEDHNIIGGLGSAVAEVISSMKGKRATLVRFGLKDVYTSVVGNQEYLRDYYELSAEKIVGKILDHLENI